MKDLKILDTLYTYIINKEGLKKSYINIPKNYIHKIINDGFKIYFINKNKQVNFVVC